MTIGFKDTEKSTSAVLQDVIDGMTEERITLRVMLEKMGESGLLLLCGLLSLPFLIPVSIPGVSTVFGAGIVLIGVAITANRLPWLPSKIVDRKLETAKLVPVLTRGLGVLRRIDHYVKPRLPALTSGAAVNRANGFILTFAGVLLMAPLGLIPFSNTLPGVAILLLATGISQRDGLVVALGHVMVGLTLLYFALIFYLAVMAGQGLAQFG